MRKRIMVLVLLMAGFAGTAQVSPADSIVIKVGESSKVIFAIHKNDLETLKYYDFQALMNDMIKKLENKDSTTPKQESSNYLKDQEMISKSSEQPEAYEWPEDKDAREFSDRDNEREWITYEGNERDHQRDNRRRYRGNRTTHSMNFDIGTNNLLSDGKFPDSNNDLYTVRPFGSWYVGINSIQRTRIAGKFFLEWGVGVSWYNFKFENDKIAISKDNTGVIFSEDLRDFDFKKSKLTASYINASLVPVIDFGGNRRKPMVFDSHGSRSFRLGAGPYVGYRIDSYSKQVYEENNDKKRDRNHDNFYLDNIRYGARLQVGFQDVDLFFNYDMNELFTQGKGPALNAFSFGVTF